MIRWAKAGEIDMYDGLYNAKAIVIHNLNNYRTLYKGHRQCTCLLWTEQKNSMNLRQEITQLKQTLNGNT